MAVKAGATKEEKDIMIQSIELLKRQRDPMLEKLNEINLKSEIAAKRAITLFVTVFVSQFMLVQYGTFIAFSWDIMEPITCGMTLGDVVIGYLFWIWSKKPYSIDGLKEFFYARKQRKLVKKNNIDYDNFLKTEEAIKIMKGRLRELE